MVLTGVSRSSLKASVVQCFMVLSSPTETSSCPSREQLTPRTKPVWACTARMQWRLVKFHWRIWKIFTGVAEKPKWGTQIMLQLYCSWKRFCCEISRKITDTTLCFKKNEQDPPKNLIAPPTTPLRMLTRKSVTQADGLAEYYGWLKMNRIILRQTLADSVITNRTYMCLNSFRKLAIRTPVLSPHLFFQKYIQNVLWCETLGVGSKHHESANMEKDSKYWCTQICRYKLLNTVKLVMYIFSLLWIFATVGFSSITS